MTREEEKIVERQSGGFRDESSRNIGHPGTRSSAVTTPTALPLRGSSRAAKPLKNSDNTFPGSGAHLNVCIHTLVYRFDERCGQNYSN